MDKNRLELVPKKTSFNPRWTPIWGDEDERARLTPGAEWHSDGEKRLRSADSTEFARGPRLQAREKLDRTGKIFVSIELSSSRKQNLRKSASIYG